MLAVAMDRLDYQLLYLIRQEWLIWLILMNGQLSFQRKMLDTNGINNVNVYESDLFEKVDSKLQFAAILTNPPIRAGKKLFMKFLKKAMII